MVTRMDVPTNRDKLKYEEDMTSFFTIECCQTGINPIIVSVVNGRKKAAIGLKLIHFLRKLFTE